MQENSLHLLKKVLLHDRTVEHVSFVSIFRPSGQMYSEVTRLKVVERRVISSNLSNIIMLY